MVQAIGHRGAPFLEDENTLQGIVTAIEHGAEAIEMDVRCTSDGHVVVMHDETLGRTTNGHGAVDSMTLSMIQQCRTARGHRVPTLEAVLQALMIYDVTLYIEVKRACDAKKVAQLVSDAISSTSWSYAKLVVISFKEQVIADVREIDPKIVTGLTFDKDSSLADAMIKAERYRPDYVNLAKELPYLSWLERLDLNAYNANLWTVNDAEQIRQAIESKLYGIMSDDIELLSQLIAGESQ